MSHCTTSPFAPVSLCCAQAGALIFPGPFPLAPLPLSQPADLPFGSCSANPVPPKGPFSGCVYALGIPEAPGWVDRGTRGLDQEGCACLKSCPPPQKSSEEIGSGGGGCVVGAGGGQRGRGRLVGLSPAFLSPPPFPFLQAHDLHLPGDISQKLRP